MISRSLLLLIATTSAAFIAVGNTHGPGSITSSEWIQALNSPNATGNFEISGKDISESWPSANISGWSLQINVTADILTDADSDSDEYLTGTSIRLNPPSSLITQGADNGSSIRVDNSTWRVCMSVFHDLPSDIVSKGDNDNGSCSNVFGSDCTMALQQAFTTNYDPDATCGSGFTVPKALPLNANLTRNSQVTRFSGSYHQKGNNTDYVEAVKHTSDYVNLGIQKHNGSCYRRNDALAYFMKKENPASAVLAECRLRNGVGTAESGDLEFVNTSSEDIEVSQQLSRLHHSPKSYEMMWLSQLPRMTMGRADCTLTPPNVFAKPGVTPVARLISSSYDADDLYGLLLRLSINDDEKPTLATRHAISALSYQHLDKDKALVYQTNATLNFDSSSLGWSIFFCGTKTIARLVTQLHGTHYGDEALILDWIFYHDAMYKFSIRHWIKKDDDQTQLAGLTKVISKAIFAPERQTVVPILGCSLELLDLVCQAVDAVFDRDDPRHLSKAHIETIRSLEIRTRNAEQRHTSVSETALLELSYAANIAELYRLATLVYLCRVGRGAPHDSQGVQELVKESFTLLDRIKFCERPWPLFVIALEARTEESRQTVLTVLEESLRRRPLGSVYLTSRMIRDAWVQQDLRDGDIDPLILYNLVVSRNRVPPSFA
ncbi:hypothetical protein TruAng_002519 [Truncatella angustata]|nr:hypothetical protein TruAng_002519 [Truncatella angustata]